LTDDAVHETVGPLDLGGLFALMDLDRPDLKHPNWTPIIPPRLAHDDSDIFTVIRERDVLVHHPYESFQHSAQHFIAAAARDQDVLAIKLTLYRTSRDSPFITSLIRAAEAGKQVACLVELRARFDESKNVRFARQLETHGVHVAYGVVGLKTHCKCSLVVRRERGGLNTYAHVGTGNYHPHTAQLYTDLGLLTCHPQITHDALNLFNLLTGRGYATGFTHLLVAPETMRRRFIGMIDREIANSRAGKPARIWAKMNALEDQRLIDKLYEASCAGVSIDLFVRGFCCLRPGVENQSENISVRSVVGRFLEHSRMFHFANGKDDPREGDWYIGSADWMARNLSGRVEAAVPVLDSAARDTLVSIFQTSQRDRTRAWRLNADGTYTKLAAQPDDPAGGPERLGTFLSLMHQAEARRVPSS
ncbi:MAG: polyphosphate kinase 1, partial [Salinibacterium sp.]|nr:polyphosphate kinase 1 [Salinibacterium sp.]